MSRRPFITQDDSPNIIIVPTVSFCEPTLKKVKIDNNDQANEKCGITTSTSKQPEPSSEIMSHDSVINSSGSSSNKSEDSGQCMNHLNERERLKPSWASNYLLSIGDIHNSVKINLSPTRNKIQALKEKSSKKKTIQLTLTQTKQTKTQQSVSDDYSCNTSKENLMVNFNTEYTYNENKVKSTKPLSKFDETTTITQNNVSNDLKNLKKQSKEIRSDKQHKDKLASPSSSKYIAIRDKYSYIKKFDKQINEARSHNPLKEKIVSSSTSKYIITPTKYKFIKKFDQSTNETRSDKRYRDKVVAPCTSSKYIPTSNKNKFITNNQNECMQSKKDLNNSKCETNVSGDKIKYQQTFQSSKNKTIRTPQQTMKSKVLKKPSPIKEYDTTSYLYDLQTLKCKQFYANYKIPKISDKNKKQKEPKTAVPIKDVSDLVDDVNIHRLSAKDVFVKELDKDKCTPPVKSIVKVVGDSEEKVDKNFDLRSKLSRRSLNHYFTKLRNLSESEPMDNVPREQRDSLLITVPNEIDENVKATGKRKLEDIKTSKNKEDKGTSPKLKKIKLVINVICEKSVTSSSDSEDEESLDDTEKSNVNLDLSFLDDFNIDEIVESLCRRETCDLTPIESKENALKDFSFKNNADEINNNKDINNTNPKKKPVCFTDTGNERTCPMYSDILEPGDSLLDKTLILTDVTESEVNEKCNKTITNTSCQTIDDQTIKISLADFSERQKVNTIDESLAQNAGKLLKNNVLNSENELDQNLGKSDVFSMKEQNCLTAKTAMESSNKFIASNISVIQNITGEDICKETKHIQEFDKVLTVLETSKTNKYIDKSQATCSDNQESLEIYNPLKIIQVNDASTDLIAGNSGETISAIRMFLETHTTLQLNKECLDDDFDKTSNSIKEISAPGKSSEINNTNCNNIETCHIICSSITRESSKMYNNINKLENIETNKLLDTIEDIKTYQDKHQNPVITNAGGGTNCDTNKVTCENKKDVLDSSGMNASNDKVEATGAFINNTKDIKIDQEELVMRNAFGIKCSTYKVKDNMHKNYIEVTKDVPESLVTNTSNNKNDNKDEIEINETLAKPEIIYTRFSLHPNDEIKQDYTEQKFEAATENSIHQSHLIKGSQTSYEKAKKCNGQNYDSSKTDISETIDLTNESDEDGEAFRTTTENKQQSRNEKVTKDLINTTERNSQIENNDFLIKSTKNERELRIRNNIQADDGLNKTKIENSSHTANCKSVNETIKYEGELKTESTVPVDDTSVTKTNEERESKSEDSRQADNDEKYVTKSTEIKPELKVENSSKSDDDESLTKITAHKQQTETTNTCQACITKKPVAISEDKSKETSNIIINLKKTDVYLARRLEDRMQQYLNKKHTITSLLHFGSFSKIYECVSESGEKYALKMMDGNKIYRNSKVEYIMKGLQRDVPRQNYNCVYFLHGFGFTKHWCILMDLYPKNLKQALQENKKSFHINVIQNLSRQLVSAVTLLRHNNIVHTNIKPTHIVVNSANDQIKLCGFDEAQYSNTIPFSTNIGTMNYLAPEVILGHSADFQIDVWSTALVMYEMATNIQLFPGTIHNDILYKQMWVCGPVPYEMLQQSRNKNYHFTGLKFMRQLKGGNYTLVPYHTIRKHDLIPKYVYLTYKNDWYDVMSYKQRQQDYAKLSSFCQLLHQMLVIDPRVRIPIEFVYADPFLFESFNTN